MIIIARKPGEGFAVDESIFEIRELGKTVTINAYLVSGQNPNKPAVIKPVSKQLKPGQIWQLNETKILCHSLTPSRVRIGVEAPKSMRVCRIPADDLGPVTLTDAMALTFSYDTGPDNKIRPSENIYHVLAAGFLMGYCERGLSKKGLSVRAYLRSALTIAVRIGKRDPTITRYEIAAMLEAAEKYGFHNLS